MNKKLAITVLLALTAVSLTTLVIAANYVESPEGELDIAKHVLTVVDPADGSDLDTYVFTGTLSLHGVKIQGKTVELWVNDGTGYVATGCTSVTDAMGGYSISWTPPTTWTYPITIKYKTRATL